MNVTGTIEIPMIAISCQDSFMIRAASIRSSLAYKLHKHDMRLVERNKLYCLFAIAGLSHDVNVRDKEPHE